MAREESGDAVSGGDLAGVLEPEGEKGGGAGEGGRDGLLRGRDRCRRGGACAQ